MGHGGGGDVQSPIWRLALSKVKGNLLCYKSHIYIVLVYMIYIRLLGSTKKKREMKMEDSFK